MSEAREDKNEGIRISPFSLEGVDMIDIRYWRNTKQGPRPTKRGVALKRSMMIRLIIALQKVYAEENAVDAYREAGVR